MLRLTLYLLVLCLPGLAQGAGELARSKSELESLSARIDGLVAEMAKDHSAADELTEDLDRLDQSKAALSRRIRQNELEAASLDTALVQLGKDALGLHNDMILAQEGLAGLIRSRYKLRDTSPLRVLLDQQDPQAAARRLTMYRYLVDSGNEQLANLERLSEAVRRNRAETLQNQQALMEVRESLDQDRNTLAREETEYRNRLASVRDKLTESEEKITLYREREKALQQLIGELSRPRPKPVSSEVAVEIDQSGGAETSAAPPKADTPKQSASVAAPKQPIAKRLSGGFSRQKGRLSLPLTSPVSARFGDRRADSGLKWEGLLFNSRDGEPVHAIFPGQVVFSDWFRGYGQLMVVDHGDGYMSLYGHNRELDVAVGELVAAGQVIARASAAGNPPVPGVYFEIRHNGAPDDPLKWCR